MAQPGASGRKNDQHPPGEPDQRARAHSDHGDRRANPTADDPAYSGEEDHCSKCGSSTSRSKNFTVKGISKAAIGPRLGLHPATVRKLAQAHSVADLTAKTEQRAHLLDDYVEHLHRRPNEGERNATGLFREIQKLGYPGGELAAQRYLRRFRDGQGHAPRPDPKPPTVREVTTWTMTHPDRPPDEDTDRLRQLRERDDDWTGSRPTSRASRA